MLFLGSEGAYFATNTQASGGRRPCAFSGVSGTIVLSALGVKIAVVGASFELVEPSLSLSGAILTGLTLANTSSAALGSILICETLLLGVGDAAREDIADRRASMSSKMPPNLEVSAQISCDQ